MPSLISETEKANLLNDFNDIFDTFHRRIVVYKEPLKTALPVDPTNMVFGFGEQQSQEGFSLTQVTGVFPATIRYKNQDKNLLPDLHATNPKGLVSIKVKRDARDFINSGRTDRIEFDERSYVVQGYEEKRSFLNSEFYVFEVKPVQ
jgi:hypothetical protein